MQTNQRSSQISVLFCDDNVINQKLAENVLMSLGYTIKLSSNGLEAVQLLKEQAFDIVLMDLEMPEMNGYEAVEQIRNKMQIKTPIIAISSHPLPQERNKCLEAGMNDYLTKPFKKIDLQDAILRNLSQDLKEGTLNTTSNSFNLSHLKDLSEGNKEFEKEMLVLFLEKAPQDFTLLQQSIASLDYESIGKIAHKMKSSLALVGVSEAMDILKYFEAFGKAHQIDSEYLEKKKLLSKMLDKCYYELNLLLDKDYSTTD